MSAPDKRLMTSYFVVVSDTGDDRCAIQRGRDLNGGIGYQDPLIEIYLDGEGLPTPPFEIWEAVPTGIEEATTGGLHSETWRCLSDRPEPLGKFFGEYGGIFYRTMEEAWPANLRALAPAERDRELRRLIDGVREIVGSRESLAASLTSVRNILGTEANRKGNQAQIQAGIDWTLAHPSWSRLLKTVSAGYRDSAEAMVGALAEHLLVRGNARAFEGAVALMRAGVMPVFAGHSVHVFSLHHEPCVVDADDLLPGDMEMSVRDAIIEQDGKRPDILPADVLARRFREQLEQPPPEWLVPATVTTRHVRAIDGNGEVVDDVTLEYRPQSQMFIVSCPSRSITAALCREDVEKLHRYEPVSQGSYAAHTRTHVPEARANDTRPADNAIKNDRVHLCVNGIELHFPLYHFAPLQRASEELGQ